MKLATLAFIPALIFATNSQANSTFQRAYAGGQLVSSSVGFRLGGEYLFNENIFATVDYSAYENDTATNAFTRLEGGMLFPIEDAQLPASSVRSLNAYALGGLALLNSDATTEAAVSLRAGARADIGNNVWVDSSLGLLGSGRGLTLNAEGGYRINPSFDVSVFLDFGRFQNGSIGLLGSFKF